MEKIMSRMRVRWFSFFVVLLVVSGPSFINAAEKTASSKLIIVPFEIGAPGSFDYLRDGLKNMLASRLAARAGIIELDYSSYERELKDLEKNPANKEVESLLQRLRVDYLVAGTLYSLQESLRLELTFYAADPAKPTRKFTLLAKDDTAVIGAVGSISMEIAEKVYGIQRDSLVASKRSVAGDGLSGFETAHPERIFKKGIYSSGSIQGGLAGALVDVDGVKRSQKLSIVPVDIDVADLDDDGTMEIVIASRSQIRIFHFADEQLVPIDEIPLPGVKIHAINLADLDGNGIKEMVISASHEHSASSWILEWQAVGKVSFKGKNVSYYLRPVELTDGKVLLGQRGVMELAEGDRLVLPGVFKMEWRDNELVAGDRLAVPESVNLFDFAYADLDGDRVAELIVVDSKEKLLVYSHDNSLIWVSEGEYGGSLNYFGPPLISDPAGTERQLTYVPTKILVRDVDKDGTPEVIIGRNQPSKLSSYRFLPNSREYDNGYVVCLSWNGKSMDEMWRTNLLNGYLASYQVRVHTDQSPIKEVSGSGSSGLKKTEQGIKLWIAQVNEGDLFGLFSIGKKENRVLEYQLNTTGGPSGETGE